ncbi:hypothetical protein C0Q70_14881 [Pomacea canaliculata]|uniref:Uncharacterized protein n=1 Tax=Pomacea canaliculata TaxID=400727 RepID=A0A2T7NTA5_POMCA|nr:hypothetical protein C0Q70_14881 [Pomacea canaliculata]
MLAATSGSTMTMVYLLFTCKDEDDRKKLVTAHDKDGLTALHFASLSHDPQVVKLLVDVGADVNAGQFTTLQKRRFALTPLHFALVKATRHAVSIAKMLLKSGTNLKFQVATTNNTAPCGMLVKDSTCGAYFCMGTYVLSHLLLPSYGARYYGKISSVGTALHLAVKRSVDLSDILSQKQDRLVLNVPDG